MPLRSRVVLLVSLALLFAVFVVAALLVLPFRFLRARGRYARLRLWGSFSRVLRLVLRGVFLALSPCASPGVEYVADRYLRPAFPCLRSPLPLGAEVTVLLRRRRCRRFAGGWGHFVFVDCSRPGAAPVYWCSPVFPLAFDAAAFHRMVASAVVFASRSASPLSPVVRDGRVVYRPRR